MNATQRLLLLGILLLAALAFTGCKEDPQDECISNCARTECNINGEDVAFSTCELSCVAFHTVLEHVVPRGKRDSCARLFNEQMTCAIESACEVQLTERCETLLEEESEMSQAERDRIYADACGEHFYN